MGYAFFGGQSESCAGGFPIILHTVDDCFKGLVEGVLNHLGMLDVGEECRLAAEVEIVGGNP